MEPSRRPSSAGFTLLELSLAVALTSAFLAAFFFGYQTYLQSVNLAVSSLRGPSEVAEMVDEMTRELEQATSFGASDSMTLSFSIGTTQIVYRLVVADPAASQDVYVERWDSATNQAQPIGPRRLIANAHPYRTPMLDASGAWVQPWAPVSLFDYPAAQAGPGNNTVMIGIHVVVQPSFESPVQYVRGIAMPRTRN